MLIYSIFIFIITLIYHLNGNLDENPVVATYVNVIPKPEGPSGVKFSPPRPTDLYYPTRSPTIRYPVAAIVATAFPLPNSNCFCSYDPVINLLLCSPLFQYSSTYPLSSTNNSLINVTLNDCVFSNNHLTLPTLNNKNIDHLWLYDLNRADYIVTDGTSFSSYTINHMHILFTLNQQITILLISDDTFSLSSISSSLRTIYIESCYLILFNKPLNNLLSLESIILIDLQQFSWYDFQQQIIRLPKLRYVYIGEDTPTANKISNVLSCPDISSQWIFTYISIQTCSCELMLFLQTVHRFRDFDRCPNSNNTIYFIDNVCQFNGTVYPIKNQTNLFCNKCLSYQCPNGSLCSEASGSEPKCGLLSRDDYETIQNRIPLTPYTKEFLLQESQQFLTINPNKTLEPSAFNSVVTILIDSNGNRTENSPVQAQMFHQTFSEMLNRPWSPNVYNSQVASPTVWQQLFGSLDESIRSINDSDPKFVFQSLPISTMSLRFPTIQPPQSMFGWQITNDNQITGNITNSQSINASVTTRVFLLFNNNQTYNLNCDPS